MDGVISDKSAGLYGSFYSIGMVIAPLLGSVIFEHFDDEKKYDEEERKLAFNKTCDVFSAITLAYVVFYVLINVLPDIRNDKE